MVTPWDFIHRLKSQNYILNKQYHVKVLLKRFHLNGNTIGFCPQTQKIEAPYRDSVICYSRERKGSFNDLRKGSNCLLQKTAQSNLLTYACKCNYSACAVIKENHVTVQTHLPYSFKVTWIKHYSVTVHPGYSFLVQLSKHIRGILGTVFPKAVDVM